jgi:hypothetical protein
VIVDVGGQDIKIIILHNGRVKDFKLNTQCSAGNGYLLQSTAEGFGYSVNQYADLAFSAQACPCSATAAPSSCNLTSKGWRAEEILAGLAAVLPKNVFLYVASIPNVSALGTRFVLQGGTQNNLAVVKAEVDFIHNSFRAAGKKPEIIVHEHCGESGAIGSAHEALRLWRNGQTTTFIGLDAVRKIEYRTTRNEDTRCHFCKNDCLHSFIDIRTKPKDDMSFVPIQKVTKVPLMHGEQRLIIATCEKGTVEDLNDMKEIKAGLDSIRAQHPNFVDYAAKEVFRPVNAKSVADPLPAKGWAGWKKGDKERRALMENRKKIRIGIPRVLNRSDELDEQGLGLSGVVGNHSRGITVIPRSVRHDGSSLAPIRRRATTRRPHLFCGGHVVPITTDRNPCPADRAWTFRKAGVLAVLRPCPYRPLSVHLG